MPQSEQIDPNFIAGRHKNSEPLKLGIIIEKRMGLRCIIRVRVKSRCS